MLCKKEQSVVQVLCCVGLVGETAPHCEHLFIRAKSANAHSAVAIRFELVSELPLCPPVFVPSPLSAVSYRPPHRQ